MGLSVQTQTANIVVHILLENLSRVRVIEGAESEFHDLLDVVRQLDERLLYDGAKENESLCKQIIELADKTEDVIDNFLVQRRKLYSRVKALFGPDVKKQINDLSTGIKNIVDQMTQPPTRPQQSLQFTQKSILFANMLCENPKKVLEVPQEVCEDYVGDKPIGLDKGREIVIKRLVEGSKKLDIVPIVGMFGLGKTTLAKLIYNDSQISQKFSSCLWINVGQLSRRDIFLCILEELGKDREGYRGKDVSELPKTICGFLAKGGGTCFIVLDDVRTSEDVDLFRTVVPENGKGHRILLTTSIEDVATHASTKPHILDFISKDESLELFNMGVFGRHGGCPDELAELGRSIAGKCRGIPISLLIAAGSLRGHTDQAQWKDTEEYVRNRHKNATNNLQSIGVFVNLSYDNLPYEMQACFLCFGMFPRGFVIPVRQLIRLWTAEGIITILDMVCNSSSMLEKRAEDILNIFVNRHLVTVIQKSSDGRIKACRVHDFIHEICKSKAEKWFSQQAADSIAVTARRLYIQSSALKNFLSAKPKANHVRAFYCFSSRESQSILSADSIQLIPETFPLIRVLDVEPRNFVFSKDLNELFHLRYIAVSGDFKVLPKSIGKCCNLQSLVLHTSNTTLEIKANIWKLSQLRHLHTNVPAKLRHPKSKVENHSLQTLSLVAPESCSKVVFAKACNLKKLGIRGNLEAFLEDSKGGFSNLEELKYLKHLKLYNNEIPQGNMKVTPHIQLNFLSTLEKLTLSNTWFKWNEMDILGLLGCLKVLKLKNNAFSGNEWAATGRGRFRKLQALWIEIADLGRWKALTHHFPTLEHLVLISCTNLEAVPSELAQISTFQEMMLKYTGKAVGSAKQIQEIKKLRSIKFNLTIFPPETYLNPQLHRSETAAFGAPSPGESSSTEIFVVQPINRPSGGSNHQAQTATLPQENVADLIAQLHQSEIAALDAYSVREPYTEKSVIEPSNSQEGSNNVKAKEDQFPEDDPYFGLKNLGNTCYYNSILQALYFCLPFREELLQYYANNKKEENVLTCLAELFSDMSTQKKKKENSFIDPTRFTERFRMETDKFQHSNQEDAHEFLTLLLSQLGSISTKESHAARSVKSSSENTWVHKKFQSTFTCERRCLKCNTTTAQDETFLHLNLEIQQNSSITSCLKKFSSETLNGVFCDKCSSNQNAEKWVKIKKPPHILVIQLKRFNSKGDKLCYRVEFPLELQLFEEFAYSLFAVVVHKGSAINSGHFISLVKSNSQWWLFDDSITSNTTESAIKDYFGSSDQTNSNIGQAYILFYERRVLQ